MKANSARCLAEPIGTGPRAERSSTGPSSRISMVLSRQLVGAHVTPPVRLEAAKSPGGGPLTLPGRSCPVHANAHDPGARSREHNGKDGHEHPMGITRSTR